MEFSLAPQERRRLASLLVAVATLLLLSFVLAVALPLLPLKLADPFWQLAFTSALCTNGFLALLAVLLLNLAAALLPEADWLVGRRQLVGGLCRWVVLAYLLLIPLQGLAAWRALDWAGAAESRAARQELQRIAQFRQAVVNADSVAALQVNLAAIQAPQPWARWIRARVWRRSNPVCSPSFRPLSSGPGPPVAASWLLVQDPCLARSWIQPNSSL